MIPEISWKIIVNITINPKIEFTSWKETFKTTKYTISFLTDKWAYTWLTNLLRVNDKKIALKLHNFVKIMRFKKLKLKVMLLYKIKLIVEKIYLQNTHDLVKSHVFIDSNV